VPKKPKPETNVDSLKGWHAISAFLSQPISVAERWAQSSGMPVERKGRNVYASKESLTHWLEHESAGEPVQIVSGTTDLSAELKRGLLYLRKHTPRGK